MHAQVALKYRDPVPLLPETQERVRTRPVTRDQLQRGKLRGFEVETVAVGRHELARDGLRIAAVRGGKRRPAAGERPEPARGVEPDRDSPAQSGFDSLELLRGARGRARLGLRRGQ